MAKGQKTGGRRPGSVNKTTASAKQAFALAAQGLGGAAGLEAWARENPTEFWKLYARLIPTEVTGEDGGAIKVTQVWHFGARQVEF